MKPRSSLAALAVAAFFLSSPALAADPSAPSAADRATARALAAEAHKAFAARDYTTAADRFARANALVHAPTLLLGLARAQAALGKLVAANESLNQILREGLAPNAPKVWADAIEEARREVTTITPRLSWITVTLTGAAGHEDSVKVLIDGVEIPSAAIGVPRVVDAGQHLVAARVDYGKGAEATVRLEEGRSQSVPLRVVVEAPPPGVKPVPLAVGGGPQLPPPPLVPPSPLRRNVGFAALGLGGAGIVMGAVTGGLVIGMHGSLASACTGGKCPASEQSRLDKYNTLGVASTVGFVAGGVFAAAGAVLVITAPKLGPQAPTVGVVMIPTAGGGALGAMGSF